MARSAVQIDRLRLRVPGLNVEQARQLGESVARRLAESLPDDLRGVTIGDIKLRVPAASRLSHGELAATIARQILGTLR